MLLNDFPLPSETCPEAPVAFSVAAPVTLKLDPRVNAPEAAVIVVPVVLDRLLLEPLTDRGDEPLEIARAPELAVSGVLTTTEPDWKVIPVPLREPARVKAPASGVVALSVVPAVTPLRVRLPVVVVTANEVDELPPIDPVYDP